MRVLVTGGAGFIGSHVAEALLADGHDVFVIDDLSTGKADNVPDGAGFAQVDVRDADALAKVFADVRPGVVSHQAAQTSVSVSTREPTRDASINVLGMLNTLDCAVRHDVSRFVFASTGGAIYGEVAQGKANVGDPTHPLSPYACSKLAGEHYLYMYRHEHRLPYTILRYANVYGPRQDPHGEAGVVAIFSQRLLAGARIHINAMRSVGDAGCIRDYVSVADVVKANLAAALGRIDADILNVCTGVPATTLDVAQGLVDALGLELDPKADVDWGPRRAGDLERSVLDERAMVEHIGRPVVLADGLAQTAAWFREQAAP